MRSITLISHLCLFQARGVHARVELHLRKEAVGPAQRMERGSAIKHRLHVIYAQTRVSSCVWPRAHHSESMQIKSPVRNFLSVFALVMEMSRSIVTRSTADAAHAWVRLRVHLSFRDSGRGKEACVAADRARCEVSECGDRALTRRRVVVDGLRNGRHVLRAPSEAERLRFAVLGLRPRAENKLTRFAVRKTDECEEQNMLTGYGRAQTPLQRIIPCMYR